MRCVTGVSQLYHPRFEIVVVADPAGLAALDAAGWAGRIKAVAFDVPNISAARNLGIAHAAGQVVAFIDDDAVPEPTWLSYLAAPFSDAAVSAAGGFVRARNGIGFQWTARDVRPDGESLPIAVDPENPTILTGRPDLAIKTEGTNMAFRRNVLAGIGGFDPVFRFYLDETDLNLRLAATGMQTAIVPMAQVHHGFAASARRRSDRVPRDLFEVGASLAVFLRKHQPGAVAAGQRHELRSQRIRLLNHMVAGRIEPRDVDRILATFRLGWADGLARSLDPLPALSGPTTLFLRFAQPTNRTHHILSARSLNAATALAKAETLAAQGHIVSVVILSPTARYHQVRFDPRGFWVQTGGIFGKSTRSDPLFRFWRFHDRIQREVDLFTAFRVGTIPPVEN